MATWACKVIFCFCLLALVRFLAEILVRITKGLSWLTNAANELTIKSLYLWDRVEMRFFRIAARWKS